MAASAPERRPPSVGCASRLPGVAESVEPAPKRAAERLPIDRVYQGASAGPRSGNLTNSRYAIEPGRKPSPRLNAPGSVPTSSFIER